MDGVRQRLTRDGLHVEWYLDEHKLFEVDFLAGVIDVDSDHVAGLVIIEHHPLRYLPALRTRLVGKIDVKGIRIGIVLEFHGSNPLSAHPDAPLLHNIRTFPQNLILEIVSERIFFHHIVFGHPSV